MSNIKDLQKLHKQVLNPGWFFKEALGCKPWSKQLEIARSVRDNIETVVASAHGVGKSWIAARIALWFLYSHSPSIVITTAPTHRQVWGILWKEIKAAFSAANYPLGGRMLNERLQVRDNWFAMGFTTNDYSANAFQGFHEKHILIIADEACGVTQQVSDGIDGLLSTSNARKLSIGQPYDPGTPFGLDFKRPDVKKFYISVFDTPNFTRFGITEKDILDNTFEKKIKGKLPNENLVTPHWAYRMTKKWGRGRPLYTAKIKGQFPEEGKETLFPLSSLEDARNRTLEKGEPVVIGADIARYGDDDSVIGLRQGPVYRKIGQHGKKDTMETTGIIKRFITEHGPQGIYVDADGLGAGVVDRLNEQGHDVCSIHGAAKPTEDGVYKNLRSELYYTLAERFKSGDIDIDPDDEDTPSELNQIRYKINSKGLIEIESKDDMKKRLGRSPDSADCMVYTFANLKESEVFFI